MAQLEDLCKPLTPSSSFHTLIVDHKHHHLRYQLHLFSKQHLFHLIETDVYFLPSRVTTNKYQGQFTTNNNDNNDNNNNNNNNNKITLTTTQMKPPPKPEEQSRTQNICQGPPPPPSFNPQVGPTIVPSPWERCEEIFYFDKQTLSLSVKESNHTLTKETLNGTFFVEGGTESFDFTPYPAELSHGVRMIGHNEGKEGDNVWQVGHYQYKEEGEGKREGEREGEGEGEGERVTFQMEEVTVLSGICKPLPMEPGLIIVVNPKQIQFRGKIYKKRGGED